MIALIMISQYAGAFWVLYGNVIDGSTCLPLQGVNVSSPFNGNGYNVSNSGGNYSLTLGAGSWNVTASKAGYATVTYETPQGSSVNYEHNFILTKPGGKIGGCVSGANATTSIVPITAVPTTTVPTTTAQATPVMGGQSDTNALLLGIALLIILLVVGYYYMKRQKPKPQAAHHAHEHVYEHVHEPSHEHHPHQTPEHHHTNPEHHNTEQKK